MVDLYSICESDLIKTNKDIRAVLLSESEWAEIHQLVHILQPFDKYTKALQSERVTLSDFFGFWTMLRIKLARAQDDFSKNLLLQTNEYHDMLMENPSILGAVFLDPRYQRGLKDNQQLAIQFLVNLYMRMQKVENTSSEEIIEVDVAMNDDISESDSFDDMDVYLNACGSVGFSTAQQNTSINNNNNNDMERYITEKLLQFVGTVEPLKKSIRDIWEAKKRSDPDLYHLATTVESGFSSLPIVLNSHRTRIGDSTLQNILLVRLNKDLIENNYVTNEEV